MSIDERIVPSKTRTHIKQYAKDKPTNWGFKLWILACPFSGYTVKFDIYTGKRGNATQHGLAYDVIFDLLDGYLSKGHIVFMDRFYSSLQLYLDLFQLGTGAVGTIMTTRKGSPKNVNNKLTKSSQRGLIRWF